MANTTNLNLVKPLGTDHALISDINGNMDIIDEAIGALPSGSSLQGEINSLNDSITDLTTAKNDVGFSKTNNLSSFSLLVRRVGRVVVIAGNGQLASGQTTAYQTTKIGTVTKKPIASVQASVTYNDGYAGAIQISDVGDVEIKNYAKTHANDDSGKGIHFGIAYITNDIQ